MYVYCSVYQDKFSENICITQTIKLNYAGINYFLVQILDCGLKQYEHVEIFLVTPHWRHDNKNFNKGGEDTAK